MRVAIQGQRGSYHQAAAENYYGQNIELVSCLTFAHVFDTLSKHKADSAIIASENSIVGTAHPVYDLLLKYNSFIVGEVFERIHHCLVGFPDATIQNISRVYSQAIALPQCSNYLEKYLPTADRIEYSDTAASVELVKKLGDVSYAAIGSKTAAKLYKLSVLAPNIENYNNNVTRFLVLTLNKSDEIASTDKASLVLETDHTPGALWQALGIFAQSGANLTKLESRPLAHTPWRYQFLVDVAVSTSQLHDCIRALKGQHCSIRLLGQYKASTKSIV